MQDDFEPQRRSGKHPLPAIEQKGRPIFFPRTEISNAPWPRALPVAVLKFGRRLAEPDHLKATFCAPCYIHLNAITPYHPSAG